MIGLQKLEVLEALRLIFVVGKDCALQNVEVYRSGTVFDLEEAISCGEFVAVYTRSLPSSEVPGNDSQRRA